jgi:PPOX class probable F420-dependent enzyme
MSDEEAWGVLAQGHTGILTTLRRDGVPIALPVWFVALDRRIYIASQAHTKKHRRIARDPRVSFLVESGARWVELVGVHLTGRAAPLEPGERFDRVMAALYEKYAPYRGVRSAMPDATRAYYETPSITIEIIPDDRILTWDNARLFRAPAQ